MENPVVNFFIVGNYKCGTTTLHYLLKDHPLIYLPEFKEPRYFCSDIHQESDAFHNGRGYAPIRTLREYHALYKNAKQIHIGDISPQYLISTKAAENIARYNADAKIIIILREPVSFLYSLYFELKASLSEDATDFVSALNLEKERRAGNRVPVYAQLPRFLFYSEWVDYISMVKRYLAQFPREQILLLLFDEIVEDERTAAEKILTFLGVENFDFEFPASINRNPSRSLRNKGLRKLIKKPQVWRILRTTIPISLYPLANRLSNALFNKPHTKIPLALPIETQLKHRYKNHVIEINQFLNDNKLINLDLISLWGYEDIAG